MYKRLYVTVILMLSVAYSQAQDDYGWLVRAIDSNNVGLLAFQKSNDAQKMLNKTGLTPPNPEVGVNYLKMNPRLRNYRFDYNVSQRLEFPTVYGLRKKVSNNQNEIVDVDYDIYRKNLVNQAINTYLMWVYYSKLGEVLKQQKEYAERISSSYQKSFERGEVTVLERNKAQVNAVNAQKEFELNAIELNTVYQELIRYNQGNKYHHIPVDFPDEQSAVGIKNTDKEYFVANNDELRGLSHEIELSGVQERLTKAERLPEFSVGYMREQDIEVDFRGVTFGMSIPLWQHKNRQKASSLNTQALVLARENEQSQYVMQVEALRERLWGFAGAMSELEKSISQVRGLELLNKALELREITMLEYLVEQSMYFELTQKYLETRMNYHGTLAELYKWTY